MSLHNQIMNLSLVEGEKFDSMSEKERIAFKVGHKEARHAAAELALGVDGEIERLRTALQSIADIPNKMVGLDWDEIDAARSIATNALSFGAEVPVATANAESYFEVTVGYRDPANKIAVHGLGVWSGLALDPALAQVKAMGDHWDNRLDTTGCTPVCGTEKLPRYLVCEDWNHSINGNDRFLTRWVVDRGANALFDAQFQRLTDGEWDNVGVPSALDLGALLFAEVLPDPEAAGVECVHEIPEWASARLMIPLNESLPGISQKSYQSVRG